MKKQLLTTLFIAGGITAMTAQNTLVKGVNTESPKLVQNTISTGNASSSKMEFKGGVVSTIAVQDLKQNRINSIEPKASVSAIYDIPIGSFFTGINNKGEFNDGTILNTPADQEATFYNYSTEGATYMWSVNNGQEVLDLDNVDDQGNVTCEPFFGVLETPILKVSKAGSTSKSYQLGEDTKAKKGFWAGGTDIIPLSLGDPAAGTYSGFKDGPSFTIGERFYDTKKEAVGFATIFQKPLGNLFARGMYMLVYTEGDKPISAGNKATLSLCEFSEEGTGNELIETEATAEDVVTLAEDVYLIYFMFKIVEGNGEKVQAELFLGETPLIAFFTGFEDAVTMSFSSARGMMGNGFVILEDGNLATVGYQGDDQAKMTPQINFHVGFVGAFPYAKIVEETKTITIPNEGGLGVSSVLDGKEYNDASVMSSVSWLDMFENENYHITHDADWITKITYSDKNIKKGVMSFFIEGAALPEGTKGRNAQVNINVCGVPVTINVTQGETVGIQDNATVAINAICNGDNIILTYPEDVTSVAIINIAGQTIANYDLPANGQFTIPAVGFNKGLYLVKFNNNQTVKVIK